MRLSLGGAQALLMAGFFATIPTSTNYSLKTYDVGSGGGSESSASYKLNAVTGTQTGSNGTSASYSVQSGLAPITNAYVPPAPTLTNPSSYYDRLKLVLNNGNNPSDTKFAIAISSDGFTTTNYVKSDHSVAGTLAIGDYQTYTAWGGAGGFSILGLQPATTYTVKVKALQGNFTGSAYGPTASAATVQPSITFTVATSTNSVPPFSVGFSGLALNTVFSADANASLSLSTNALLGGAIYVRDTNSGLKSSRTSGTVLSTTADLGVATSGYGLVVTSVGQAANGPLGALSPYNGTGNNVGALSSALQQLASTPGPITGGTLSASLKAKVDISIPSSSDYSDTVTFVAAMAF